MLLRPNSHWLQGVLQGLTIASLALFVACSPVEPIEPTITPRPTLAPRTPATALPTATFIGEFVAGEALQLELPGGTFAQVRYTPVNDQVVSIVAKAISDDGAGNPLDVVMRVLDANSLQLAYNDDQGVPDAGLAPSDAKIQGLSLIGGEVYTIEVNAFNGFQRGQVEIQLQILDE